MATIAAAAEPRKALLLIIAISRADIEAWILQTLAQPARETRYLGKGSGRSKTQRSLPIARDSAKSTLISFP
jgi:hypothetical protein